MSEENSDKSDVLNASHLDFICNNGNEIEHNVVSDGNENSLIPVENNNNDKCDVSAKTKEIDLVTEEDTEIKVLEGANNNKHKENEIFVKEEEEEDKEIKILEEANNDKHKVNERFKEEERCSTYLENQQSELARIGLSENVSLLSGKENDLQQIIHINDDSKTNSTAEIRNLRDNYGIKDKNASCMLTDTGFEDSTVNNKQCDLFIETKSLHFTNEGDSFVETGCVQNIPEETAWPDWSLEEANNVDITNQKTIVCDNLIEIGLDDTLVEEIKLENKQQEDLCSEDKQNDIIYIKDVKSEENNQSDTLVEDWLGLSAESAKPNDIVSEEADSIEQKAKCLNQEEQNNVDSNMPLGHLQKVENEENETHVLHAIKQLKNKLTELHSEKDSIQGYIKDVQGNMTSLLSGIIKNTQDAMTKVEKNMNQKQTDLLDEMKVMNQELNQRGEAVSKLKSVIASNKNQMKELLEEKEEQRLQVEQIKEELSNTKKQQMCAASKIKEMESEMGKFKDGDGLSTSTVSRAEEVGRLKDIEDTFEDRYIKLRKVAAKLKKQATEVTQQIELERQKASTEKSELMAKLNQLSVTARNTQSLQQECDRLNDELEKEKNECDELRKAAGEIKANEVNLKVKLEEAQTSIQVLKIDLNTVIQEKDMLISKLSAKEEEFETSKKEKSAEELIRKEKSKEIAQLTEKLKEEREKNAALTKQVEAAKIESRKLSVISLEIQDYEKSLSDMRCQLASEKTHVSSLEAEVATLQDIRSSLLEQIKLIEERLTTEESRWEQTNEQLLYTRSCLQSAESELMEQNKKVALLTEKVESERASSEAAALKLASLSSDVQNSTDLMLKEKQALTLQVTNVLAQLASTKEALERSEEESARIKEEFDKYKVRAQSVLRKHQSSGPSREEKEAKQEAETLRESLQQVKTLLEKTSAELEQTQTELNVSTNEREAAETRCVNLNIALEEKSSALERTVSEHRSQKLSLDTLLQCYKSQLEEKEKNHQEFVSKLQDEIDSLRKQLKSNNREAPDSPIEAERQSSPVRENVFTPVTAKPSSPLWERGDGEGSENTNGQYSPSVTPPQTSPKPLLPLDKLLASNDIYSDHGAMEAEIANLKTEIEKNKVRLHHQAALLSESEQDAARNKELINCLKKEIGRLERCIKMQPHAQNTEYLKNIVFKFVTLDHGDDRLRLVPVISTLLQLSPEETQSLTTVAKGESDAGASWGNYFPSWR